MTPEYIERLAKAVLNKHLDQTTVMHAEVFHEDECRHWVGAMCTCHPDVLVKKQGVTYKVLDDGQLAKTS